MFDSASMSAAVQTMKCNPQAMLSPVSTMESATQEMECDVFSTDAAD